MSIHERKKKKSGRRLLLIIISVLILLITVIGAAFFIWGQNSPEKKAYEDQIRQEAREFTDGLLSELEQVEISDDAVVNKESPAEPQTSAGQQVVEVSEEIITEAEKQVIAEELAKLEDARKQQALKTLTTAYSKALDQQKKEAFKMVEALIEQGKADWKALTAKGENTAANKGRLATEYLAKSQVLEEQMDASFKALISKMEEQLIKEGLDPAPIIERYKDEYKKTKEENKSRLMDKVLAAVKK